MPTAGISAIWNGLIPYDVEAAKALLDEAGWVEGSDGIRVAQGAEYAEDGTRLSVQLNGYTNFQPLVRLGRSAGGDVQGGRH